MNDRPIISGPPSELDQRRLLALQAKIRDDLPDMSNTMLVETLEDVLRLNNAALVIEGLETLARWLIDDRRDI
jgi:hypothetical protein